MHELKSIVVVTGALILSPLIIAIITQAAIAFVVWRIISDFQDNKFVKRWLKSNEQSYFIVYSSGKRKRKIIERYILPNINPGINVGTYNGSHFTGFVPDRVALKHGLYGKEGFPIIGRVCDGALIFESLKNQLKLVLSNKSTTVALLAEVQPKINQICILK